MPVAHVHQIQSRLAAFHWQSNLSPLVYMLLSAKTPPCSTFNLLLGLDLGNCVDRLLQNRPESMNPISQLNACAFLHAERDGWGYHLIDKDDRVDGRSDAGRSLPKMALFIGVFIHPARTPHLEQHSDSACTFPWYLGRGLIGTN